jgi:hypothetical protein
MKKFPVLAVIPLVAYDVLAIYIVFIEVKNVLPLFMADPFLLLTPEATALGAIAAIAAATRWALRGAVRDLLW